MQLFNKNWFIANQGLILKIINSPKPYIRSMARDILCLTDIPEEKNIISLYGNRYTVKENKYLITDFRTHLKYKKRVYYGLLPLWQLFHTFDRYIANALKLRTLNLGFDTLTVYPDPDPETNTVDGRVIRWNAGDTWVQIRDGAGTHAYHNGSADMRVRLIEDSTSGDYLQLYRGVALFDTSSIADGNTIDSATLSFYGSGSQTDNVEWTDAEKAYCITAVNPDTDIILVTGDYATFSDTDFATRINHSNVNASAYTDWTLNASGLAAIDKTGISKFGFRNASDVDDTDPGSDGDSGLVETRFYAAEQTGTANDPKLVVIHSSSAFLAQINIA